MSSSRNRLVRRAPLMQRVKAYLNPWDFLLWLSEEVNGNDWDDFHKDWARSIGVGLNVVFMISRANMGKPPADDVFGDYHERAGSGWLLWLASFLVHLLTFFSCINAAYTFLRKRHYRLFEASVEVAPSTPSARRVKVDASPMSSSPFRFLTNIIASTTAESRTHPDHNRDVWELAIWDPTPLCLRLFCTFSPGHVLIHWLFLPVAASDIRPSVTVFTAIALTTLFSLQLSLMQTFFSQQAKDSALVHKEVLHEYDAKFVGPSLHKVMRDVSTQSYNIRDSPNTICEVFAYPPTTYVNRSFQTNPNPNYSSLYDPYSLLKPQTHAQRISRSTTTPDLRGSWRDATDFSSPLQATPSLVSKPPPISFSDRPKLNGNGGSFGILNHARSPVRKSTGGLSQITQASGRVRDLSPSKREGSPLKRASALEDIELNQSDGIGRRLGYGSNNHQKRETPRH